MFTILENYKALLKMCMSADFNESGAGANPQLEADINAAIQDFDLSEEDLSDLRLAGYTDEQIVSGLEGKSYMADSEMLAKLKEGKDAVTEFARQEEVTFAQTNPGNPYTTAFHTSTGEVPSTYTEMDFLQDLNAWYTRGFETNDTGATYPTYTTEDFTGPNIDTFNGHPVYALNELGVPADGSQYIEGRYYKDAMNQVMRYTGECLVIEHGAIHIPGSNPMNPYAETFQGECGPENCPILETYVPIQPEPQIVYQPYTPWTNPLPAPTPPTYIDVNCFGEDVEAQHVQRYGQYDVYVAEGKIFRIHQTTGKVEERLIGTEEKFTAEQVRNHIHDFMNENGISVMGISLSKTWTLIGENGNICTGKLPTSGNPFGGGGSGGSSTGGSNDASAPGEGSGSGTGGNSF